MTGPDVEQVLQRFPRLTAFGMGIYEERKVPLAERPARIEKERGDLRRCTDEMTRAEQWLRSKQTIMSPNRRHSSYGYKHMAEEATGAYICNGALIAAAVHCGFEVTEVSGSPNVLLNISEKSLRGAA